jgi:lipopolysaccharide biosynthesis protein
MSPLGILDSAPIAHHRLSIRESEFPFEQPALTLALSKMCVPSDRFRLDFCGGTMFWVRPEALLPLRELRLASAFAEEKGLLDGGLEHAVERLFATSVVAAGYRLESWNGRAGPEEPARADRGDRDSGRVAVEMRTGAVLR